jgi:hypothetical protein
MGNTKAIFATGATVFTAAVTIVACGSDHAAPDAAIVLIDSPVDMAPPIDSPPDAPSFDFSCSGNAAPTPDANVTISGTVNEVGYSGGITFEPLAGAAVDLCTGNCMGQNNLGSGTTDGSGAFSFGPIATGGSAVDGYARVTNSGDRTILAFPAAPVAMDVQQPIITFQDLIISALGQAGCDQDAQNGMVAMFVTDCSNAPISDSTNLTISAQQGGSNVGDPPLDAGAVSSMAAGFFLICNVPPGTTTVTAKYGTMDLRAHDVLVTAGTTTETIIRPGF